MINKLDPKKKALDELQGYLDGKDGEELGSALKPKAPEGLAVEGEEVAPPEGEVEGLEIESGEKPQMSDEELAELIEALQAKLGV